MKKEAFVYFCHFHFFNFLWPGRENYGNVLEMFCLKGNLEILSAVNMPILYAIAKVYERQIQRRPSAKLSFVLLQLS